jgi:NhaP-type Na+/H+ or K+/H+ antiporter
VLLVLGILSGSVFGLVEPEKVFGDALQPLVSLSVGFILFEGGMTLKLRELKDVWRSLVGLLTVGVLVTWTLASIFAYYILGMPMTIALVFAAVLTVTGPTVIGPLLREIRPKGNVGAVAKWEGIVIDPIGATFAVLVFEATESIRAAQFHSATVNAIPGFGITALAGIGVGSICGWALIESLRRYWVPGHLKNPVVVMFVTLAFVLAESLHHEAGLVSVTFMGIWLANQRHVDAHGILEFKETITVLLISVLFIVLAARIDLRELSALSWRGPLFAAALILIVRPASVFLSTIGSKLTKAERIFLAWFAPRGIVAAAVSSVFALRMGEEGQLIAPATFIVIISTVAVYGLTAGRVARALGLAVANPQGILIGGANPVACAVGLAIKKAGYDVLLVDSRYDYVAKARDLGLRVHLANILSDYVIEELDLGGLGRFFGLTSNDQINTLAAVRFRSLFGEQNVFQLPLRPVTSKRFESESTYRLEGRDLFNNELTYDRLEAKLKEGWTIRQTKLTSTFTLPDLLRENDQATVLFYVMNNGALNIVTVDSKPRLESAASVVYIAANAK